MKVTLFIIAGMLACNAILMAITSYVPWAVERAMHNLLMCAAVAIIIALAAALIRPRDQAGFALLAAITCIALLAAYGAYRELSLIR